MKNYNNKTSTSKIKNFNELVKEEKDKLLKTIKEVDLIIKSLLKVEQKLCDQRDSLNILESYRF